MSRAPATAPEFGLATRLVHAGLALSIIIQLLTSLIMEGPRGSAPGDGFFTVHKYAGYVALAFSLLFWLVSLLRRRGTELGALFPWLSAQRLRAVLADIGAHVSAGLKGRLPVHDGTTPLASAVHGLGLALMTLMAVTGTIYGVEVGMGWHAADPHGMLVITIHRMFANLVWAYLIGHAVMGLLHHLLRVGSLSRMWSFSG